MKAEELDQIEARYTADPIPPCRVCGGELSAQSMGGGRATEYACGAVKPLGTDFDGPEWKHYRESHWTQFRSGDSDVLRLIGQYRAVVGIHRLVMTETPDDRWECCESCGADWPCPSAEAAGLPRT